MNYSCEIKGSAAKSLRKIPRPDRVRLIEAIDRLYLTPYAGGVLKGEFAGLRRLRIGRYRIVYEVLERKLTILVVRLGRRSEVYRQGGP